MRKRNADNYEQVTKRRESKGTNNAKKVDIQKKERNSPIHQIKIIK